MAEMVLISGILGIFANVIIYIQKKGKKMLIYKLISDFIWALHYFSLFAYSGMAVALLGAFRETVFIIKTEQGVSKKWLMLFIACAVGCACFTWNNAFSILPAISSVLSVISFWRGSPALSRILSFPISICMFTYDIICKSYFGIANEIFTVLSSIAGIIFINLKKDI